MSNYLKQFSVWLCLIGLNNCSGDFQVAREYINETDSISENSLTNDSVFLETGEKQESGNEDIYFDSNYIDIIDSVVSSDSISETLKDTEPKDTSTIPVFWCGKEYCGLKIKGDKQCCRGGTLDGLCTNMCYSETGGKIVWCDVDKDCDAWEFSPGSKCCINLIKGNYCKQSYDTEPCK